MEGGSGGGRTGRLGTGSRLPQRGFGGRDKIEVMDLSPAWGQEAWPRRESLEVILPGLPPEHETTEVTAPRLSQGPETKQTIFVAFRSCSPLSMTNSETAELQKLTTAHVAAVVS